MHISLDSALGRQRRLNSVGESVLQIAPDAAAAYSLRSLTGGDPNVVRVRRESDNTEKDFSGSQIESGEMARWVNEQPTLPLDLRELDTNTGERDGALIEAAAAYSLRKLKEDFTGDVVEVRRNVDGETEGFTAAEVTDGTLESFVNASFDDELPLDQATGAAAAYSLRNLKASGTDVTTSGDTDGDTTGKYVVQVRRSSDNNVKSFTAAEVADGESPNVVDLYAISGQSNAAGRANTSDAGNRFDDLDALSNRVFIWNRGSSSFEEFDFGVNQHKTGGSSNQFGPESELLRLAALDNPNKTIYVVKYTEGGTSLYNDWDSEAGSNYYSDFVGDYNNAVSNLSSQGLNIRHRGVLYAQGERDSKNDLGGGVASYYKDKQKTLVENLRTDLNQPSLPVALTLISVRGTLGDTYTHIAEVNQAKEQVANELNNVTTISSLNFGFKSDDLHYNGDGQIAHGAAFFEYTDSFEYNSTLESWVGASLDIVTPTLNNGGFETAGTGGFDYWLESTSGSSTVTRDTSEFYSGTASCRFDIDSSGSFASIRTDVPGGTFKVGTTLTYSIRAKGTSGSKLLIGTASNDSRNDILNLTTEWQEYTGTVNPADTDSNIQIKRKDSANATIWIDEVTFIINGKDGHVKTWYDQSGNANHATQTTDANQPKIVDAGSVLEDSAGNPEIDFDGTSHRFDIDFGSNLSQPNSIFMVHQSDSVLEADNDFFDEKDTTGQRTLLDVTTSGSERRYRMLASTGLSSTNILVTTDKNLVSALYNGSNSSMSLNGDLVNFTNTVGGDSIAQLSSIGFSEGSGNYYDGTMQEFIVCNSDQSDKRRAIEENIANHYDITLAAYSRDGTVSTWYDQSGSDNHATQTDTAKQPKIVDGGSLLADGVKFDGTDDGLRYDGLVLTSGTFFSTSVVTHADGTNTAQGQIYGQYPGNGRWYLTAAGNDEYQFFASCDVENITQVYGFIPPVTKLLTAQGDGSNFIGFSDGLNIGSDTYDTFNPSQNVNDFTIGFDHDGTRPFDGSVAEIIIYNSDQSDNRTAIEANMGEHYGITEIPAANDTVNGYVQTWYDQSGEGNDAEQPTAENQPKIVGEVTSGQPHAFLGAMRFDDNQFLETTNTFTYGSGTTLSTFITTNSDGDESAYLFRFSSEYIIYNNAGGGRRVSAGTAASAGNVTTGEELWTTISALNTAGGTSNFYVDGTLASAADAAIGTRTVSNRVLNIGGSGASTHWNGTVNEVILYATDQSSNRTAIEANIINHYDI